MDRTAWISWLRVLAISGVVAIHTVGYTAVLPDARSKPFGLLAIIMDIGAIWAVPLFVMVSGALLLDPTRYRGAGDFLRRRALRLVPAIVFWHLFYVAFRFWYLDQEYTGGQLLRLVLNGDLFTGLYFFWIVLGLAVATPALVPWLREASRTQVLVGAALACAMPVLTISTIGLRGAAVAWVETPWTWWIFYLGVYLLGWGLRGVVLRGWWLALATVAAVVLTASLAWQWRNPAAPEWLQTLSPVSYYGLGVQAVAALLFLVAQGAVREGGVLRVLARGRLARAGGTLGAATLGVFALHLGLVQVSWRLPVVGGDPAVTSSELLVARWLVVLVTSFAVTLVLRRVPVVRQVF